MELTRINRNEVSWRDDDLDIDIIVVNCNTEKEAERRLIELINKIKKEGKVRLR